MAVNQTALDAALQGLSLPSHLWVRGAELHPGGHIEVTLDGDCGVSIGECSLFTRDLRNALGEDFDECTLEVASGGIDAELKTRREFVKNIGRKLEVQRTEGKPLTGILTYVDASRIGLMTKKLHPAQAPKPPVFIHFSAITQAKAAF